MPSDTVDGTDYIIDDKGLPLPDVPRRRLNPLDARVRRPRDVALQSLIGSLYGVQAVSAMLGVDRKAVRHWLVAKRVIPLPILDRLIALAREQSAVLAALAVRLETVDKPVLEERRRIVRKRQRDTFINAMGYTPEENQVMRRRHMIEKYPPGSGNPLPAKEAPKPPPGKRLIKNF